jgi:predicted metalloenzyme YecM
LILSHDCLLLSWQYPFIMNEKNNLESILGDWRPLLETLVSELASLGIDNLQICDHICYRVESLDRYASIKSDLLELGSLAAETLVSGRNISIIKLKDPLEFQGWQIDCVELPAPKVGSPYSEGWEHAEFVVPKLDEFIKKHSNLDFNTKAMGRDINPELGLKINSDIQVKFHPLHILKVIEKEKELGVTKVE